MTHYQVSLEPLFRETMRFMAEIYDEEVPFRPFEPTGRAKQVRSIVAKLQRESTRLSAMQDIVGFRIVVPHAVAQENLLKRIPSSADWKVVDRRANPMYGYRAVHVIHKGEIGSVEVQIRTDLQHGWAELSELSDRNDPGIKYGKGLPQARWVLDTLSEKIYEIEQLELEASGAHVPQLDALRASFLIVLDDFRRSLPGEDTV